MGTTVARSTGTARIRATALARAVSGTMMFLAHVVFAYNVYTMTLAPHRAAAEAPA